MQDKTLTSESAAVETSKFKAWEKAKHVILAK